MIQLIIITHQKLRSQLKKKRLSICFIRSLRFNVAIGKTIKLLAAVWDKLNITRGSTIQSRSSAGLLTTLYFWAPSSYLFFFITDFQKRRRFSLHLYKITIIYFMYVTLYLRQLITRYLILMILTLVYIENELRSKYFSEKFHFNFKEWRWPALCE